MREGPIVFSGEMVRAILREENPKTVTRRLMSPQPVEVPEERIGGLVILQSVLWDKGGKAQRAVDAAIKLGEEVSPGPYGSNVLATTWGNPYGDAGDRLWVRETFWPAFKPDGNNHGCVYRADYLPPTILDRAVYHQKTWKPSIFMPRWASRISLEVHSVRAERLQEISEDDASREGVWTVEDPEEWQNRALPGRAAFSCLWDKLNGKRAPWESNPWVWRIEFRRIQTESPANV